MTWMITVREPYVSKILAGKKTIELRTRIPKMVRRGDTLLIIQAGTNGRVRVKCKMEAIVKFPPRMLYEIYKDAIQVEESDYFRYFGGAVMVYGIILTEVEELPRETYRWDFGVSYSPQWFAKVTCDKVGLL